MYGKGTFSQIRSYITYHKTTVCITLDVMWKYLYITGIICSCNIMLSVTIYAQIFKDVDLRLLSCPQNFQPSITIMRIYSILYNRKTGRKMTNSWKILIHYNYYAYIQWATSCTTTSRMFFYITLSYITNCTWLFYIIKPLLGDLFQLTRQKYTYGTVWCTSKQSYDKRYANYNS